MDAHQPQAQPLIRKLESIFTLTGEEKQALIDLPMQVQELRADQDIVRERDRVSRSCALLEGFACRYKITPQPRKLLVRKS